jgi:uncharacterized membrane protein
MSKLFNRLNLALAMALLVATFFGFVLIPAGDNLPAHWNISGAIDQFGPRSRVLIMLPLAAAVVAALLVGIEISFRRMQLGDVRRQFALVLSVCLALFAAKQASTVLIGLGHPIDVPRIVAILQGLGLIAIGNMLPKQGAGSHTAIGRRNEGRRQYRVSKLMGILFIVAGVALFVVAMTAASPKWLFALNLGGVVVAATSGLLYACLLAKLGPTQR